jgi:hypothetical protein
MKTYNKDQFEAESKRLQYDVALKELFGNDLFLIFENFTYRSAYKTAREHALKKSFSMVPLWYLQFLISESPSRIVDIGCGANIFKSVIKKLYQIPVHGIDPEHENPDADECDVFDEVFSQGHTGAYESVFSIDALHFVPLSYLTNIVTQFHNIIAPGGSGFLTLNSARMVECSCPDWLLQTFNSPQPTPLQIQDYVRNQLHSIGIEFLVLDLLITTHPDEYMDGNIRMVFKK